MRAYDLHQHLWPEPFLAALARRSSPPRLRGRTLELTHEPASEVDFAAHELEARLGLLDRHELDAAVISLPPTLEVEEHEELREAYHAGILELASAAGGRLVPLAAGACLDGFAGACVSAQQVVEGLGALPAELEAAGKLLFVHPGPPARGPHDVPVWWPALADYTAQMQAAFLAWLARDAAAYPGLPVVFAMLAGGAPFQLERLRSRGVEIRTTLHASVYLEASSYGRRALELCLATYGVTQMLFGSDAPVLDPRATLDPLASFGPTLADLVLRENASRILE